MKMPKFQSQSQQEMWKEETKKMQLKQHEGENAEDKPVYNGKQ
jgi:hypothetical protein